MILVSFSSAEDALSNDVKEYDSFSSQSTENLPFRFFEGDTRYNLAWCKLDVYIYAWAHSMSEVPNAARDFNSSP